MCVTPDARFDTQQNFPRFLVEDILPRANVIKQIDQVLYGCTNQHIFDFHQNIYSVAVSVHVDELVTFTRELLKATVLRQSANHVCCLFV